MTPPPQGEDFLLPPEMFADQAGGTARDTHRYAFFGYEPHGSSGDRLVDRLAAAAPRGRAAMEALAATYVDGATPGGDGFVSDPRALVAPLGDFVAIAQGLRSATLGHPAWLEKLRRAVAGMPGDPSQWLAADDYAFQIDRAWQSCFALTILSGYHPALLNDLERMLWLDHAIRMGLTAGPGADEIAAAELTPAQSLALAGATMALPATIFPLPPAVTGD